MLRSGRLSLGPAIDRFEELVAERVGAPYAAAVSSGTTGLHLLCVTAGIGPGDEVIVPDGFVTLLNEEREKLRVVIPQATAARQVSIASARKPRCVDADVR